MFGRANKRDALSVLGAMHIIAFLVSLAMAILPVSLVIRFNPFFILNIVYALEIVPAALLVGWISFGIFISRSARGVSRTNGMKAAVCGAIACIGFLILIPALVDANLDLIYGIYGSMFLFSLINSLFLPWYPFIYMFFFFGIMNIIAYKSSGSAILKIDMSDHISPTLKQERHTRVKIQPRNDKDSWEQYQNESREIIEETRAFHEDNLHGLMVHHERCNVCNEILPIIEEMQYCPHCGVKL
nr:hypothetical protein [Candidatus Sigynarchaeota archaeon]